MSRSIHFQPIAGGAAVTPPASTDGAGYRKHVREPSAQSPAQILRREHGRSPLRCDEGPIVKDLAISQLAAAILPAVVHRAACETVAGMVEEGVRRVAILVPPSEDPGLAVFKNERLGLPWDGATAQP